MLGGALAVPTDRRVEVLREAIAAVRGGDAEAAGLRAAGLESLEFDLRIVDVSWARLLMLGCVERYGENFRALQLVPRDGPWIDTPDMSIRFDREIEPAWTWLADTWSIDPQYPRIRANTMVLTDVNVLRGSPILEVARVPLADDGSEWECWSVASGCMAAAGQRLIPLATVIASDPAIRDLVGLEVGEWATRAGVAWDVWSG